MAPGTDLSFLAREATTTHDAPVSKKSLQNNAALRSKGPYVLEPSLITQEFDLLRFEAAAFDQLQVSTLDKDSDAGDTASFPRSTLLISSPYNNPEHYLDLTTLPLSSLLFAKALTALKPTRPDYATAPYTESLNFDTVLSYLQGFAKDEGFEWKETSFYVVIFRSKLNDGIDTDLLYKLDFESHREACESGGLLKYWFGKTDVERRNLATCFWHSREDAYKGGTGPWHKKARAAGRQLYERITFSVHRFTVLDGAEGFTFEDWKD